MTSHHHIGQKDLKEKCPYCGSGLKKEDWRSEFEAFHHYKHNKCGCGKTVSIKVDFHGSGHDDWSGLEKKIIK